MNNESELYIINPENVVESLAVADAEREHYQAEVVRMSPAQFEQLLIDAKAKQNVEVSGNSWGYHPSVHVEDGSVYLQSIRRTLPPNVFGAVDAIVTEKWKA